MNASLADQVCIITTNSTNSGDCDNAGYESEKVTLNLYIFYKAYLSTPSCGVSSQYE